MNERRFESLPLREQLRVAVRDLWSMPVDSGETHIIFQDRRHLSARVALEEDGEFSVSWEPAEGGEWITQGRRFDNPREAALHAYQGPHD
jgi:hypothetical protein